MSVVDDFVKVQETDFEEKLHFSPGTALVSAVDYKITGDAARDRMFVSEVLEVGPGKPVAPSGMKWLSQLSHHHLGQLPIISDDAWDEAMMRFGQRSTAPPCNPGDIVITNLSSVSYRHPVVTKQLFLRGSVIMATIDRETYRVGPVQHYVLIKANDKRVQKAISRSEIWVPTEGMATDDRGPKRHSGITAAYGEVVDQGPGRWEEGKWFEPQCAPGQLVLYDSSYATLPITIRGKSMVLVASTQIVDIVEDRPESMLELSPASTPD